MQDAHWTQTRQDQKKNSTAYHSQNIKYAEQRKKLKTAEEKKHKS